MGAPCRGSERWGRASSQRGPGGDRSADVATIVKARASGERAGKRRCFPALFLSACAVQGLSWSDGAWNRVPRFRYRHAVAQARCRGSGCGNSNWSVPGNHPRQEDDKHPACCRRDLTRATGSSGGLEACGWPCRPGPDGFSAVGGPIDLVPGGAGEDGSGVLGGFAFRVQASAE